MKIVIIGTAYPHRGGIAHFNALLYQTFKKRGHEVIMISFTRQYPALFFPGKTQFETGKVQNPVKSEPMLDSISPLSWFMVAKRVREISPDLVIFKYWLPFFAPAYSFISALVKAGRNTRILYVCDNIIPHERRPGDKLLTKLALANVDRFIVMSKSVENDLLSFKPRAKFSFVNHPVYEIFGPKYSKQEAKQKLKIRNNDPIILFFGFIRHYKGLHLLLEAFPKVLQHTDARLLIAGEFYEDRTSYMDLIKKFNISDKIILNDDFIPDEKVGLFFSAADLVALPYISATQSGVIQVAYNYDKPVVATPVGGLPEVVIQNKTGYIVEKIDARSIADGIVHLLDLMKRVNFEKNINDYKKKFSWNFMIESIENLIYKNH